MPILRATAATALAGVLTVCTVGTVRGQEPRSAEARAVALYEESEEHYREGRFAMAAMMLREAYGLFPDPDLLYNLARAYEGSGNLEGALESYARFLEAEPETGDRGAIEARMETLRAQLEEREELESERVRAEEERREAEDRAVRAEAEAEAVVAEQTSDLPWVMGGVGVASLVAGGVFRVLAERRDDAADSAPTQDAADDARDDADDFTTLSNVALVTGAVLTAAGAGWLVLRWLNDGGEEAGRLEATPMGLQLRGTF